MSFVHRSIGPMFFPSILWHTNEPAVHITFDDGPHPGATPAVLDILRRRNVAATFFLVGTKAARYPELVRQIAGEGHAVGNHTYSHTVLFLKPKKHQVREIQKTDEIVEDLIGTKPLYFRPPHGYFDHNTLSAAEDSNHKVAMWDVDPHDFNARTENTVAEYIRKKARRGSIILLHDSDATEHRITSLLGGILDRLEERGIHISPLPV